MAEKSAKLSELMSTKGKRKEKSKRPVVRDYKEARAACGRK